MRVLLVASASTLLCAALLGLGGCARQNAESDPEARMRVAQRDRPEDEERAPATRTAAAENKATRVKSFVAKAPTPPLRAGSQDEASCTGVETCTSVLKAMVTAPDRSWVERPAAPTVLANGVRLFAYRALKPALTCRELSAALSEVGTAARTFSSPVAGLEPEKTARVRSLSAEVEGELQVEQMHRCPTKASKGGTVG